MNEFIIIDNYGVEHHTQSHLAAYVMLEQMVGKVKPQPTVHLGSTLVYDVRTMKLAA